ncbi:hypothetical protein H2203_004220 [Taxawa tesnikishii (nom. ined.)]|nr:hypothetical protein H2203_004220 [Dothideales sp. JES 119]
MDDPAIEADGSDYEPQHSDEEYHDAKPAQSKRKAKKPSNQASPQEQKQASAAKTATSPTDLRSSPKTKMTGKAAMIPATEEKTSKYTAKSGSEEQDHEGSPVSCKRKASSPLVQVTVKKQKQDAAAVAATITATEQSSLKTHLNGKRAAPQKDVVDGDAEDTNAKNLDGSGATVAEQKVTTGRTDDQETAQETQTEKLIEAMDEILLAIEDRSDLNAEFRLDLKNGLTFSKCYVKSAKQSGAGRFFPILGRMLQRIKETLLATGTLIQKQPSEDVLFFFQALQAGNTYDPNGTIRTNVSLQKKVEIIKRLHDTNGELEHELQVLQGNYPGIDGYARTRDNDNEEQEEEIEDLKDKAEKLKGTLQELKKETTAIAKKLEKERKDFEKEATKAQTKHESELAEKDRDISKTVDKARYDRDQLNQGVVMEMARMKSQCDNRIQKIEEDCAERIWQEHEAMRVLVGHANNQVRRYRSMVEGLRANAAEARKISEWNIAMANQKDEIIARRETQIRASNDACKQSSKLIEELINGVELLRQWIPDAGSRETMSGGAKAQQSAAQEDAVAAPGPDPNNQMLVEKH